MKNIILMILFLLFAGCGFYGHYITESGDKSVDPCLRIISVRPLDGGFKEVTYIDTCKQSRRHP